jgi:hypothetical protein
LTWLKRGFSQRSESADECRALSTRLHSPGQRGSLWQTWSNNKEQVMSLGTILLIVLILILIGVIPAWPHARSWGYAPSGIVGVILIIVLVLLLLGRL